VGEHVSMWESSQQQEAASWHATRPIKIKWLCVTLALCCFQFACFLAAYCGRTEAGELKSGFDDGRETSSSDRGNQKSNNISHNHHCLPIPFCGHFPFGGHLARREWAMNLVGFPTLNSSKEAKFQLTHRQRRATITTQSGDTIGRC